VIINYKQTETFILNLLWKAYVDVAFDTYFNRWSCLKEECDKHPQFSQKQTSFLYSEVLLKPNQIREKNHLVV